jgi:DNA-binding HxlR family transcriptional regulator
MVRPKVIPQLASVAGR